MSETSIAPPPLPSDQLKAIAHWLHTAGLLALLVLSTVYTRHRAAVINPAETHRMARYAGSITLEWVLLGLVMAGIYRRREFLRGAFMSRMLTLPQSMAWGVAVYAMGFMAIAITGSLLYFTPLFHKRNEAAILAIAPHTVMEFALWFGVSLTAGVCEELIFRGYLMRQLAAWTRNEIAAIFLSAAVFGAVHLYEGIAAVIPLAALAIVFGFVVRTFKGDLRSVIVAHTLQDFIVAFILLARPYLERYQPKA